MSRTGRHVNRSPARRVFDRLRNLRVRFLTDLFVLSGGQIFGMIVGFLVFAYLARVLGPVAYGNIEYGMGLVAFFTMIVTWGLGPIGVRDFSRNRDNVPRLAAHIPSARLVIALLAVPAMGLMVHFSQQSESTKLLVWLLAFSLLGTVWNQDWLFQGHEMMGKAALARMVRVVVFALVAVVLIHSDSDVVLFGYAEIAAAIAMALYCAGVQHLMITPVRFGFSIREIWYLLRQGASIGGSQVLWSFNQYLPLFLVANMIGGDETAWFGASHRVAISLATLSWVYHFNLYPSIARRVSDSPEALDALLRASFRVTSWVGVGIGLVLALLANPLMTTAFGSEFKAAAPVFAVLVWVVPVTLLSGHGQWTLIASGRQSSVLYAQIAGAAVTLIVAVPLLHHYKAMGAAFAMLAATVAVWAAMHIGASKLVGKMPALEFLWWPVVLALALGTTSSLFDLSPWVAGGISGALYFCLAPVVDRRSLAALRLLARAKGDVGTGNPPPPS